MPSLPDDYLASTHPRPQLRRPFTDLSGPWGFAYDDANVGLAARWPTRPEVFDQTIIVPFPPESPDSGIGDDGFHPVVWYRRTFDCRPAEGAAVVLHFGSVDYRAAVWLNGQLVVEHEGGHSLFSADITSALRPEGEQVVVVRAEDLPHDLTQPRGKQDWQPEPHAIWYRRTTGIWQRVWWEEVPQRRLESLHWVADPVAGTIAMVAQVGPTAVWPNQEPLWLRVRASMRGELLVEDVYQVRDDEVRREVGLSQGRLGLASADTTWSPEHPNLIDVVLDLQTADGRVVDQVHSYTALRAVSAGDGRFQLNGKPYFLRLVLEQGYWPGSHLASPSEDAIRREVELVKELGFNGVRLHQRAGDPRFLYWCDRLGLLVWAEMPSAYEFSERSLHRVVREWLDLVERDRSHPCVIAWVPFNESWGLPALPTSAEQRHLVTAVYHLTKALDPTRPVVGNDGWEQVVSDILTVHDYSARGETLRERYGSQAAVAETLAHVQPGYRSVLLADVPIGQQPVMITEFGGITLGSATNAPWSGYGNAPDVEAFLARYTALVDALLDSPDVTGFCYTQLTDTVQEQNGLLTEGREPKVPLERIRAVNTRTSAAVPADSIGQFEYGDYPAPLDDLGAEQPPGS